MKYNIPIRGPTTEAIPKVPPINPVKIDLFLNGVLSAIMIKHPLKSPAPPAPIR